MKLSTALTTLGALAIAAIAGIATPTAQAQAGGSLLSLSHQLEGLASELRDEFSLHYQQDDAFRPLMRNADLIETELDQIHGLVRNPYANLHQIQASVRDLDRLAARLDELVAAMSFDRIDLAQGNDPHVRDLLRRVAGLIDTMSDEVEDLRHGHQDPGHGYGIGHAFRPGISFEDDAAAFALGRD